jgi:galactitol-specific phosphotransferase system IIB component
MEKSKIIEITENVENKSNKDLFVVLEELSKEFENTKTLIIDLTRHLEAVEDLYNKVNREIEKRTKI